MAELKQPVTSYILLLLYMCIVYLSWVQIASASIPIGQFTKYAHGLESGVVTLTDTKTMLIQNFKYDGLGPDAWFQVAIRPEKPPPQLGVIVDADHANPGERDDLTKNPKIPDENGSCDIVKEYKGKDISLVLPSNLTFANIEYVALYCYKYEHNFGFINIPKGLGGLKPFPANKTPPDFCNGSFDSIMHMLHGGSSTMFLFTSLALLFNFPTSIMTIN